MSDELEQRLQQARTQQVEAGRRRAQAEAKLDSVQAQREKVMSTLKDLGFQTPEEARARAVELKEETETILKGIEEKVSGL